MIIALEIGAALSASAMLMVLYVSSLPKPKRVKVHIQDRRTRR
ncbi:hypothetical protein KOAAANKH_02291 [Brevundimonas sp. NIBR10]|nr:hypothetical protein [Brevundimonas sp. NIBR10]WGM47414.1 hypothetical protein KOAAANKH_02291 [Brevundimonas sp. NIBR10]